MALADRVLALHKDIHEVFIIEDRAGNQVAVGEASRKGFTLLADSMNVASKHGLLAPMIILGSASQFCGGQQSRLVGIEYEKAGLVLAPFNENKLLALSTKPESLRDVMQTISEALPQLKERAHEIPEAVGAVNSTAEAENSARSFLAGRLRGSARILVDEVSYRTLDQQWEVHGAYRSRVWSLSRRFQVEVDANDGSVKRFAYSSSPLLNNNRTQLVLSLGAIACVIAASLLALALLAGLWK